MESFAYCYGSSVFRDRPVDRDEALRELKGEVVPVLPDPIRRSSPFYPDARGGVSDEWP